MGQCSCRRSAGGPAGGLAPLPHAGCRESGPLGAGAGLRAVFPDKAVLPGTTSGQWLLRAARRRSHGFWIQWGPSKGGVCPGALHGAARDTSGRQSGQTPLLTGITPRTSSHLRPGTHPRSGCRASLWLPRPSTVSWGGGVEGDSLCPTHLSGTNQLSTPWALPEESCRGSPGADMRLDKDEGIDLGHPHFSGVSWEPGRSSSPHRARMVPEWPRQMVK